MSPDYRSMYDSDYIGFWDLQGKDVVVTIDRVEAATLTGQQGRKSKKPVVHFKGHEKGMAINKTNGKAICGMYGPDTSKWIGKQIVLYPTKTQFGSETVDCIRVRPTPPKKKPESEERVPGQEG